MKTTKRHRVKAHRQSRDAPVQIVERMHGTHHELRMNIAQMEQTQNSSSAASGDVAQTIWCSRASHPNDGSLPYVRVY